MLDQNRTEFFTHETTCGVRGKEKYLFTKAMGSQPNLHHKKHGCSAVGANLASFKCVNRHRAIMDQVCCKKSLCNTPRI
jgi:hypothetical protein